MVKKSNEDNRWKAITSIQLKYNDDSTLKKMERLKIYLVCKLTGLAVGFHLSWWRGKIKNEENWSGKNTFEGQGVRKLRIQFYTYSV